MRGSLQRIAWQPKVLMHKDANCIPSVDGIEVRRIKLLDTRAVVEMVANSLVVGPAGVLEYANLGHFQLLHIMGPQAKGMLNASPTTGTRFDMNDLSGESTNGLDVSHVLLR